jgi:hypothetical protein
VQVAPWKAASYCDWTAIPPIPAKTFLTATTAWTPLAAVTRDSHPLGNAFSTVATDSGWQLQDGTSYCVRVRARSDRDAKANEVVSDWTQLGGVGHAGFTYSVAAKPPCAGTAMPASAYREPTTGSFTPRTPLFTWDRVPGACGYYVVVARDQDFTKIVDIAYTLNPAYAPRGFLPTTYADETTSYYWAVLPSSASNGTTAPPLDALLAAPANFQKQSTPPVLIAPTPGAVFTGLPTFQWSPVVSARRYRLQVAADPSFSDPIDDLTTDATSYTSNTTYPPDTVLYWRVRADDENLIGLTWSATGTFQKRLSAPALSPDVPTAGETLPVLSWSPVQGAASYDVAIDQPDGRTRQFSGFRAPIASFIKMTGTGVWHWRVRAIFPQAFGSVAGPWSESRPYTRTIGEPGGVHTETGRDHLLLSWSPKFGIRSYRVEIAARPDFASRIETATTENTTFAPTLQSLGYRNAGQLFWRVAAVDADGNVGDFSRPQPMRLLPQLRIRVAGTLRRRHRGKLTVIVSAPGADFVAGAHVTVAGRGVPTRTKTTGPRGATTFQLRPTRRGRILVSAAKPGYQPKTRVLLVK